MPEPTSSVTLAAALTTTKLWSIIASFAGSIVPILAISDQKKITFRTAVISAIVGTSFAVFIGPIICNYFNFTTPESISAISWVLGGSGIHILRAIILWIDNKGSEAIDRLVNKGISLIPGEEEDHEKVDVTVNVNQTHEEFNLEHEEHRSKSDHYKH